MTSPVDYHKYDAGGFTNGMLPNTLNYHEIEPGQNTTSTSYTDLATVGPTVTLVTGTEVNFVYNVGITRPGGRVGFTGFVSIAVTGASSMAAADGFHSAMYSSHGLDFEDSCLMAGKITGLTPGVNTFTLKYRCDGTTFQFYDRFLAIFP